MEAIEQLYLLRNGAGGMSSALSTFAPDCEYVYPETALEPGTHVGHAGMVKALEALGQIVRFQWFHDEHAAKLAAGP